MALQGQNCCSQQGSNGDSGFNVMADFLPLPLNGCTNEGGCGQRIIVTLIILSSGEINQCPLMTVYIRP